MKSAGISPSTRDDRIRTTASVPVMHRNGNRADNRPENLQLISQSERVAQHTRLAPKRKKGVRSAREQATM